MSSENNKKQNELPASALVGNPSSWYPEYDKPTAASDAFKLLNEIYNNPAKQSLNAAAQEQQSNSSELTVIESLSFISFFESLIKPTIGGIITGLATMGTSAINADQSRNRVAILNSQLDEIQKQIEMATDVVDLEKLNEEKAKINEELELEAFSNALVDFVAAIPNVISSGTSGSISGMAMAATQLMEAFLKIARNPQADRYSKIYNPAMSGGFKKDGPELQYFDDLRTRKEKENQVFDGMKQQALVDADADARAKTSSYWSYVAAKQDYMNKNFDRNTTKAKAKALVNAGNTAQMALNMLSDENISPQAEALLVSAETEERNLYTELTNVLNDLGLNEINAILEQAQNAYSNSQILNQQIAQAEAGGIAMNNTINNATSVHVDAVNVISNSETLGGVGQDVGDGLMAFLDNYTPSVAV